MAHTYKIKPLEFVLSDPDFCHAKAGSIVVGRINLSAPYLAKHFSSNRTIIERSFKKAEKWLDEQHLDYVREFLEALE